jgi:hypothetical protein
MSSDRQIAANRANAQRSTGPKTPEGKARACLNAVRHGLTARDAVLPEEDRAAYLDLLAALEAEHQPQGPTETFLVRQMASAQWRLQRLTRIETGLFMAQMEKVKHWEYDRDQVQHEEDEARTPEEQHDEQTRLLGVLFYRNSGADSFATLARYENMLNREYFRAFKALQTARKDRQQAADETNPIPPPPRPVERASTPRPASAPPPESPLPRPQHHQPAPIGRPRDPSTPSNQP